MELKAIGSEKRHIAGMAVSTRDAFCQYRGPLTKNCELADGKRLGVVLERDHD